MQKNPFVRDISLLIKDMPPRKEKDFKPGLIITVNDKMQQGYRYVLVCRPGQDFAPDFTPELTPAQMLRRGVFEGHYLTDCQNEFPTEWFEGARLCAQKADVSLNAFKIKARQPLSVWRQKGWIIGPDVRGWFQWYCRYYLGRRLPETDRIQIKRWRAFKRHKAQVLKHCPPGRTDCRPRQRQALLQWAYNPDF